MADKKVNDPAETTGISVKNLEPDINTDDKTANLPPSTPAELRQRAEVLLPEKDAVQKAYKQAMTATDHQTEAKAKATIVDESPNADQTPSGVALKKVQGIANDTERGEAYTRERAAIRHGWVPVEGS
jgi:hypothetical protein